MTDGDLDLAIQKLGECRIPSPGWTDQLVGDHEQVLHHHGLEKIKACLDAGQNPMREAGERDTSRHPFQ